MSEEVQRRSKLLAPMTLRVGGTQADVCQALPVAGELERLVMPLKDRIAAWQDEGRSLETFVGSDLEAIGARAASTPSGPDASAASPTSAWRRSCTSPSP